MKKIKVTAFSDGGHSWLAVKRSMIKELGIENDISSFSYQKGQTVYLEEDSDLSKFVAAFMKDKEGKWTDFFEIKESYSDNSPVRNYARYSKVAPPKLVAGLEVTLYGDKFTLTGKTYSNHWIIENSEKGQKFKLRKSQESELLPLQE